MGWIADLLSEIPSAARYKVELEQLEAEHMSLKQENQALRTSLESAKAEIRKLKAATEEGVSALDSEKEKILILLSRQDRLQPEQIARACGFGLELAKFHLSELSVSRHIATSLSWGRVPCTLWRRTAVAILSRVVF